MNQNNNNKITNSFFFFVDFLKEIESSKYLKIDNFFKDTSKLYPNAYFSIFSNSQIDFDFLEKNEKLISFFLYNGKLFFKNQIKNLKICSLYEEKIKSVQKRLNISFFLNLFYFFRHIYCLIFLLKKISFIKFSANKINKNSII